MWLRGNQRPGVFFTHGQLPISPLVMWSITLSHFYSYMSYMYHSYRWVGVGGDFEHRIAMTCSRICFGPQPPAYKLGNHIRSGCSRGKSTVEKCLKWSHSYSFYSIHFNPQMHAGWKLTILALPSPTSGNILLQLISFNQRLLKVFSCGLLLMHLDEEPDGMCM